MVTRADQPLAAVQMADTGVRLLDSLDQAQKAKATYQYMDGERLFWYYPPLNRHGLPLRDMEQRQRELALDLMASGLTESSYEQAKQIIDHELVLGEIEKETGTVSYRRDPELYYFTVFGEPGGEDPWGWRVEGHHISLNYSVWRDKVISMTPFFFGANPAEVRKGAKTGLRILGRSQDMAFELMDSLDAGQRSRAIIYESAPADIVTFNATKASLPREEGLPASRMSGAQKELDGPGR